LYAKITAARAIEHWRQNESRGLSNVTELLILTWFL